jgi:hypothetical protein
MCFFARGLSATLPSRLVVLAVEGVEVRAKAMLAGKTARRKVTIEDLKTEDLKTIVI